MAPGKLRQGTSTPPELHPPRNTLPQGGAGRPVYYWLWLSLAAVLILGLLVVFMLPGLVDQPAPASAAPATVSSQEASTRTNQAMQAYLQLRALLELEGASRWGEPEWSQAATAADAGARHLAQRRVAEAAASYTLALQILERLPGERIMRLAEALAAGERALADGAAEVAVRQFEQALVIEPGHATATRGLARATVRTEVLQAVNTGAQAENKAEFTAAQLAYQRAVSLDGDYEPAIAALRRVEKRQQDAAYQDAMSQAITSLDAGRLNAAARALAEAARLKPDAAAVADGQQRLARARQQAQLNRLRRDASAQVRSEHWQAAADLYTQALAIDSGANFANNGLARARERVKLHNQFDHYLDKPARIYSPEPLANARKLLAAASAAPVAEPLLAGKVAALRDLVAQAGSPIAVTLDSDGATEVTVYHVGELGQFTRHRLKLLPGSYTVVGTRRGYRDVRKQLSVKPGSSGAAMQIICEEPI